MFPDWLCYLFIGVVFLAAVFQHVGMLYAIWALRTKAVPCLWGIDWLDVVWRLERRFGICLDATDFQYLAEQGQDDVTAGEVYAVVCRKLWDANRPIPAGGWNGVRIDLHEALHVRPFSVRRSSLLIRDLGMLRGID
jgi:hypothetical protein